MFSVVVFMVFGMLCVVSIVCVWFSIVCFSVFVLSDGVLMFVLCES